MKNVKKSLSLLLVLVLAVSLFTACGSSASNTESSSTGASAESSQPVAKSYTIGVVEAQATNDVSVRRQFYEKYIAPAYNVKFIFSEVCQDDTATKAFIENCIDMGADAIIDFKSCNTTMAKLCEENGLVYVINSVPRANNFDLYEGSSTAFAGGAAGNMPRTGAYMGDWIRENGSDDGSEGFLIASCVASSGVVEHIEITRQCLEALQEKYGLTYTMAIDDIVMSPDPVIVENDKGINIYVYPGSPNKDTWLSGISPLLQTGSYGVFISCGETYDKSANVVSEVENAKDIDIKVLSLGAVSGAPVAFATLDKFGNPSVDLIIATCSSVQNASLFAVAYNALTNGTEVLYENGLPTCFVSNKLAISSQLDAELLVGWDELNSSNYVANTDVIDAMLLSKNPSLTVESLKAFLEQIDFNYVKDLVG